MVKRTITALVLLPVFVMTVIRGGLFLPGMLFLLSSIGLIEFYGMISFNSKIPMIISLAVNALIYILGEIYLFHQVTMFSSILMVGFVFLAVFFVVSSKVSNNFDYICISSFGLFYIIGGFYHLVLISNRAMGDRIIWVAFLSAWACDTFAYFGGMLFGKRKLIPYVSPKKTIEGAISGLLGCVLIIQLYGYLFISKEPRFLILLGFSSIAIGIGSQFGDLIASLGKRKYGIKDYGNLIPGHGGVLDRFDSILITAPLTYIAFIVIMSI